ncbi:MAG: hypothetical protein B0D92_03030 [Spirochaeta sp. LUC14_002_19_P3]|nr:MAG: hypothetical protein B0D92_03030 [Spirochaeta sp. LUC14_002_19_P3]
MNEAEDSIPSRNNPEMPSYMQADQRGRDSFLSQIGVADSESRTLFYDLCDMEDPFPSVEKVLGKLQAKYPSINEMLDSLMRQLVKGRCGLITLALKNGTLQKDRIILTERDDLRFWYWYIENAWLSTTNSDSTSFPTVEDYKRIKGFPADSIYKLTAENISSEYASRCAHEIKLCSFQSANQDSQLLLTPASIMSIADITKSRIHRMIKDNSTFKNELIRYLNIVVSDFEKLIAEPDGHFWLQICRTIISKQKNFYLKKIKITQDIIHSVSIVQAFIQNKLSEAEDHLKEEEKKSQTLKDILFAVAKHEKLIMGSEEFVKQFEPYDDRWPDLQAEFSKRYMTASGKKSLTPVVMVGMDYLYRDNIYILFKSLHNTAGFELQKYYMKRFSDLLRSRNKSKFLELSSVEFFRRSIKDRIIKDMPGLDILMKNPRLVADGIIHYGSKVLKKNDKELVKTVLERYFIPNTVKFKPYDELFSLSLLSLFEDAFSQLSLFHRILMRISGRYNIYLKQYNPLINHSVEENVLLAKGKRFGKKKHKKKLAAKSKTKSKTSSIGGNTAQTSSTSNKTRDNRSHKVYSARQREMAWSEFSDVSSKKNSREIDHYAE